MPVYEILCCALLILGSVKEGTHPIDAGQSDTVAPDAKNAKTHPFAAWAGRWTAGMAFHTGAPSEDDNGVRGRDLVIEIDDQGSLRGRIQEHKLGVGFRRSEKENDYQLQGSLEMIGSYARLVHGKNTRGLFPRAAYLVMTRPCVLTWVDRPPTQLPLQSFLFSMVKTGDQSCPTKQKKGHGQSDRRQGAERQVQKSVQQRTDIVPNGGGRPTGAGPGPG